MMFEERAREQIIIDLTDIRDHRRAQAAKARAEKMPMVQADCESYAQEIDVLLKWYRNRRNAEAYPVPKRRAVRI